MSSSFSRSASSRKQSSNFISSLSPQHFAREATTTGRDITRLWR